MDILGLNISNNLLCRFCKNPVTLIETDRQGLGSKLAFYCSTKKCKRQQSFPTCNLFQVNNLSNYSINRRSVFAMRSIGADRAELQTLCGVFELPPPVQDSSYNCINRTIESAAVKVQADSMQRAGKKEYNLAERVKGDKVRNIDVSCDGSWMTPGHSSMVGAATVIGCQTGKVLDTGTRSKTCKSCEHWKKRDSNTAVYRKWQASHKCTKSHQGSSGSMEAEIMKDCFETSVEKHKLRYTGFVGDGDTNTYSSVVKSKPYGDTPIEKLECVGHIQKRMGNRLRNLKKKMGKNKLADGKTIGGKGRLTNKQIDKIQRMYGNAIRRNKNNLKRMKEHVWAVYFHKLSTDSKPLHHMCSAGCPYKKAQLENKDFKHKKSIPEEVMTVIKPVFQDLAHPDLLSKCLKGLTQNANESINNLIWKFAPKKKNHGVVTVNTAVALAVGVFNDGAVTFASVLKELGLFVGPFARKCFFDKDVRRVRNAARQEKEASHEARIKRRQSRLEKDEQQEQEEGFPYLAGGHHVD